MTGDKNYVSDRMTDQFSAIAKEILVHQTKKVQEIVDDLKAHADKEEAAYWLNWINTRVEQ